MERSSRLGFNSLFKLAVILSGVGTSSVEFTSCLLPEVTVLVQIFHYSIFGTNIAICNDLMSASFILFFSLILVYSKHFYLHNLHCESNKNGRLWRNRSRLNTEKLPTRRHHRHLHHFYLSLITFSFSSSLNPFEPCFSAWIKTGTDCALKSGALRSLSMSSANSAVTCLR